MKTTLKFEFDDNETDYMECLIKSRELFLCLREMDEYLRNAIKYHDKWHLQAVRTELKNIMDSHDIREDLLP